MLLIDALRHLHSRGHAPEHPEYGKEFLAWALADGAKALLQRYQRYHGLPPSGTLTPQTVEKLIAPRCGHPDILPVTAGESAWAIGSLAYWQEIVWPGVDPAEVAADYALAISRVAAVCGIQIGPATSQASAQVVATTGPIDGPWNVLALSELPPAGDAGATVLNQTFDVAEVALTQAQRQAMMAHEFCHCLGLGHDAPGSGDLMDPVLGTANAPGPWSTAQLLERYPLQAAPPPATAPAPAPAVPPYVAPAPIYATTSLVSVTAANQTFSVGLDAPGKYLIIVVPLPG